MTQGLHRIYGGCDLHFITFSCFQRKPFFKDAALCDLFLKALERVRRRYRFVVLGYVVMPEHVHLLVSEPQRDTLSTAMQALKLSFIRSLEVSRGGCVPKSRALQLCDVKEKETKIGVPHFSPPLREVGTASHFWQARFYDFNVWTEKKRIEKLRYIHRNPVRAGLVISPEQWLWSSFRWYSCGEQGRVRINDTEILVIKIRPRHPNQVVQGPETPMSRNTGETWGTPYDPPTHSGFDGRENKTNSGVPRAATVRILLLRKPT